MTSRAWPEGNRGAGSERGRSGRQRAPEVEGALHLPEAGPGDCDDTLALQQLPAVEEVGRLALLLGRLHCLWRQPQLRVAVQRCAPPQTATLSTSSNAPG